MDTNSTDLLAAVLNQVPGAALRIDGAQQIASVHNSGVLQGWLEQAGRPVELPHADLAATLDLLFLPQHARSLLQQLREIGASTGDAVNDLGVLPMRLLRTGTSARHLAISAQRLPDDAGLLFVLRDVSTAHDLQLALTRALAAVDTTMAVLRAAPDAMRLFLGSAMASVSAIRATLRMPARHHAALREKLSRLQGGAEQLGKEAQGVGLDSIGHACSVLTEALTQLQQKDGISGNDLLPLALFVDGIASAVGNAWRAEEQRYCEPQPQPKSADAGAERRRSRKSTTWPPASERRWNEFLRRRGEEIGTLARLSMSGAEIVAPAVRRDVDEMLQHLLRNALEHGLETPEQRLTADKPAAGQISVRFEDKAAAGLRIVVRDDGRGLDPQRIGKAAVKCGLISEESLLERDAVDLVGLIFKPAFTTEGMDGEGHGRGMTYLRNAVTRLNGQISVATKAGRYTQFTIQLPLVAVLHQSAQSSYAASLDKA
jgi:signal transduction histidine kinase